MKGDKMKHDVAGTLSKGRLIAGGFGWVAGLILAGSDSDFMPWLNGAGLLIFWISSMMMSKPLMCLNSTLSRKAGRHPSDEMPSSSFIPSGPRPQPKQTIQGGRILHGFVN